MQNVRQQQTRRTPSHRRHKAAVGLPSILRERAGRSTVGFELNGEHDGQATICSLSIYGLGAHVHIH